MPTHFLRMYKRPSWAAKEIDCFRRSLLWRGKSPDKVQGDHCLVKWKNCTLLKKPRGLGIKDLEKFSIF
jgi:hypothetical protein